MNITPMKLSPQITQINTDYKKYKKNQCNLRNLWTSFFYRHRERLRNHEEVLEE